MNPGTKLTVFSVRRSHFGTHWCAVGTATVNKDGSLSLVLDRVVPVGSSLHVREVK